MRRSGRPAGRAEAARLQGQRPHDVARLGGGRELGVEVRLELLGGAAAVADQEGRPVALAVDPAGHIGVQTLDPVGETQPLQEFQGAIDRGWLGWFAMGAEGARTES